MHPFDRRSETKLRSKVKLENLMLLSSSGPPHLVLIDLGVAESLLALGWHATFFARSEFPSNCKQLCLSLGIPGSV